MDSNKTQISKELKEKVFRNFNGKCYFCNKSLKDKELFNNHCHHFIPEVCGGGTNKDNLVLCCYDCHTKIHSKSHLTYGEIRMNLYALFCNLLDIVPCFGGWDDDLESVKEELKISPKEVSSNWKKLIFCLKFIDKNIGLLDIPYKIKDFNLLIDNPIIPKTIEEFALLEKNPNEYYKELTSRDKQIQSSDKGEEIVKV